jgi:adenylate kinase
VFSKVLGLLNADDTDVATTKDQLRKLIRDHKRDLQKANASERPRFHEAVVNVLDPANYDQSARGLALRAALRTRPRRRAQRGGRRH